MGSAEAAAAKLAKRMAKTAKADLRAMAQVYTNEALQKIVGFMRNGKTEEIQFQACTVLLDRGWGKPAQEQVVRGDAEHPVEIRLSFKSNI